jgi:hypothetical protein
MIELVCRDGAHMRTWRLKFIHFVELRWRDRLLWRVELR